MKNFIRKKEDFVCERCGERVAGDGYTDHCPKCLWGKHVDEEIPGDRDSDCKGLMEPVEAEYKGGKFRICYKCEKCNHRFVVDAGKSDNKEEILKLVAERNPG